MSIGDESPRGETIDGKFRPRDPRCASAASRQNTRLCKAVCNSARFWQIFSSRRGLSGTRTRTRTRTAVLKGASTLKTGRKKQGIVRRDQKQKRVSQRLRRENLHASWSEKWSASADSSWYAGSYGCLWHCPYCIRNYTEEEEGQEEEKPDVRVCVKPRPYPTPYPMESPIIATQTAKTTVGMIARFAFLASKSWITLCLMLACS